MKTAIKGTIIITALSLGCSSAGDSAPGGNGRDAGPGEGGTEICGTLDSSIEAQIPTVVLLVDRSGSMAYDYSGDYDEANKTYQRWNDVYTALMHPTKGVIAPLQDKVRFGLSLYTTSKEGGGICPYLSEVDPKLNSYDDILELYDPAGPLGETPTGESLAIVAQTLKQLDAPGPKVIVLATDGDPDTCDDPFSQTGQDESIAAVQTAYAAGIRTYVLSVGNEVTASHLQDLANAGAGLPLETRWDEPYYRGNNAAQLADSLQSIVGDAVTCLFTATGSVDRRRANEATVTLDGRKLAYGSEWRFNEGTTVELLGSACDTLQNGSEHDVDGAFPCDIIK